MIDLQPSGDQQQIVDAVSLFLAEKLPVARHRKEELGGALAPGLLKEISGLGWIGLGVPERAGGHGYTFVEDLLVCRELGRHLAPMALFAGVLGARLAAAAARADLARCIIAGDTKVAIALRCEHPAEETSLLIVDGPGADWLLGLMPRSAYLMPCADLTVLERLHPIDASIDLERRAPGKGVPGIVDAGENSYWEALLLGAGLLAGMAEATRDMAVAYAKERQQFGQPIGAFQAIKHFCADSALRAEAAKSQLFFAAIEKENGSPLAPMHATAAKIMAADAALLNAGVNIQIHGGFGFTAECDAHLYVKRAHVLEQVLGPQRWHQSMLGTGGAFQIEI